MTQVKKGVQFPVESLAGVSGTLSIQVNGTLGTLKQTLEHVFQGDEIKGDKDSISLIRNGVTTNISLSDEASTGNVSLRVQSEDNALAKSVSDEIASVMDGSVFDMPDKQAFKTIDPVAYTQERLGSVQLFSKAVQVVARLAVPGEKITTMTAGENGNDFHETVNTAKDNQVVITNPGGEQYIIDKAKFESRYDAASLGNENKTYNAKAVPTQCIKLDEGVEFTAPWGEKMSIQKGGVLVLGGGTDIYGIQPKEFADTYKPCDETGKHLTSSVKSNDRGM